MELPCHDRWPSTSVSVDPSQRQTTGATRAHYVSVSKAHGANTLPDRARILDLVTLTDPPTSAKLTIDPEPYFQNIDLERALKGLTLKAAFTPDGGTIDQRLPDEMESMRTRRRKESNGGVFLVIESQADDVIPESKARWKSSGYSVCLNHETKSNLLQRFRAVEHRIRLALSLSLAERADPRTQRMGDVLYWVDPIDGQPIFAFTISGRARGSLARPLSTNAIEEAATFAMTLTADESMRQPAELLTTSLEDATNDLPAFVAAWAAIEIFVKAAFTKTASDMTPEMRNLSPKSVKLPKQFRAIASALDPEAATRDADEFQRLYDIRNQLFHESSAPSWLPTEAVQALLLRYLRQHLLARHRS